MADFELSVRYKTLPTRVGFGIMCALVPVWALIAPVLLGLMIGYLSQNTHLLSTWPATLIILSLVGVYLLGTVLTAFTEDDRLFVSKDGIAFPLFLLPILRFKRNRAWDELRGARLLSSSRDEQKSKLILSFDNADLPINLSGLNASDKEQLMLAIELWGTNCQRSPELVDYQMRLQNELRGVKASYTQMWEEELSRRFNATSFVPLEPNAVLQSGKLRIIKQMAFGGLSAIYQAQSNENELVVVKEAVIPQNADAASRKAAEERIRREAQFLMRLKHDHIAGVLDHFVEDGRHYLVLEYVHGQDLRQYIKQNGPQSEEKVRQWTLQIAGIVKYLHEQAPAIVHRDLTPDNLVLRNDGDIVLIDFGAANEFIGQATGTLVGKQAYMAPEQLRGKAVTQSDLYSLGCTIFYLLVGRDPTPLSVSHPREALPQLSEEIDRIVADLTAFEPDERTNDINRLVQSLQVKTVTGAVHD